MALMARLFLAFVRVEIKLFFRKMWLTLGVGKFGFVAAAVIPVVGLEILRRRKHATVVFTAKSTSSNHI